VVSVGGSIEIASVSVCAGGDKNLQPFSHIPQKLLVIVKKSEMMKKLVNLFVAASVLLVVYVLVIEIGFKGTTIIEWGFVTARTTYVLLFGNFLMLIAIVIKLSIKEEKRGVIHNLSGKEMLFWISSFLIVIIVIIGVGWGFLWFYSNQIVPRRFNQIYYDSRVWE
jgi:hypothetical protein